MAVKHGLSIGNWYNINTRPNPWRHYMCSKKKNRGYSTCEGTKVKASKVENAVMDAVLSKVITPEYVMSLVEEVNDQLNHDHVGLDAQIRDAQRGITEIDRAISNLIDMVENHGSQAAADRLLKREAEREELARRLIALEQRSKQSRIDISPEVIEDILMAIRDDLTTEDIRARRAFLRQFVHKVEIGSEGGILWYSFPLKAIIPTGMWLVPPRGYDIKTCQRVEISWD